MNEQTLTNQIEQLSPEGECRQGQREALGVYAIRALSRRKTVKEDRRSSRTIDHGPLNTLSSRLWDYYYYYSESWVWILSSSPHLPVTGSAQWTHLLLSWLIIYLAG